MKLPILAGATLSVLSLLTGCAATDSKPLKAASAATITQDAACKRGKIDATRVFIFCAGEDGTAINAMQAMNQPVDPTLSISDVAAEYGVAAQAMTGIEAATYARIVGTVKEKRARSTSTTPDTPIISINGRNFRKIDLSATGKKPATLFVEG